MYIKIINMASRLYRETWTLLHHSEGGREHRVKSRHREGFTKEHSTPVFEQK